MPTYQLSTRHGALTVDVGQLLKATGDRKSKLVAEVLRDPVFFPWAEGTSRLEDLREYLFHEEGGKPLFDNRREIFRKIRGYVDLVNSPEARH